MEIITNNVINGIAKLNEIEEIEGLPSGWVIRESILPDGTLRGFEYGIYLNPDMFVGVPVHISLKEKMIKHATIGNYNYYVVPNGLTFGVSKYTNKNGKVCPILVPTSEKYPFRFIMSYACKYDLNIIKSVKLPENAVAIRKFIDKERKFFAIIAFADTNVINPSIKLELTKGIPGTPDTYETAEITFTPNGISTNTVPYVSDNNDFTPEFVKFNMYINNANPNHSHSRKPNTFKKNDSNIENRHPYFAKNPNRNSNRRNQG